MAQRQDMSTFQLHINVKRRFDKLYFEAKKKVAPPQRLTRQEFLMLLLDEHEQSS